MAGETNLPFGELLKEHRLAAGLTQEALAERAAVSTRGIQALERGVNQPLRDTARRLIEALDLDDRERARIQAAATPAPRRRLTSPVAPVVQRDGPENDQPAAPTLPAGMLIFLIADVRGYTAYTHRHGDEAGAKLATRFAALAGQAVEGQGGQVVEVRGDEVMAVFTSARKALRAAVDLLALCDAARPELPLRAGVGLDVGEPVPVPGGYRGEAINVAARLCARAAAGEVLASDALVSLARRVEGLVYEEHGSLELKGLSRPVRAWLVRAGFAGEAEAAEADPRAPAEEHLVSPPPAPRHNLPAALSSFVGRDQDQARVLALLENARLMTLTGAGGVGKTRLALRVAAAAMARYPDGAWLVELAALSDPVLVPGAVAQALGVREEPGRPLSATLEAHLRGKHLLLILDNCEHLLEACAALVGTLLQAAPALRLLVTSREGLGVRGETRFRVQPLPLPPAPRAGAHRLLPVECLRYEAVGLFVERARARLHTFALTEANTAVVAQLCRTVDGLPLALELAAARVAMLTVDQIVARLDDRFRLLAAGDRDLPPHQRTLRATLEWSHDLLLPDERVLFRRLAVFTGWSLEAAEVVCAIKTAGADMPLPPGDVLDLLGELAGKSLVVVETVTEAAERPKARYRLLETVRAFAEERLSASGEGQDLRAAHADWYTALAEEAASALRGALQTHWLTVLDTEGENLRAALAWARDTNQTALGLRLATALWRYWYVRGRLREGRDWLDAFLAGASDDAPAARAAALQGAASLAEAAGAYEQAVVLSERSLALHRAAGDHAGEGAALNNLGNVARELGDLAGAARWFAESLALGREAGNQSGVAGALNNLGTALRLQGDLEQAESLARQSLTIRRTLADHGGMAIALDNLSAIAFARGDLDTARVHGEEALMLWRAVGDTWGIATGLAELTGIALRAGEFEAAERWAGESLSLWEALEDGRSAARVRNSLGRLARLTGDPGRAGVLHRESLSAAARFGDRWGQLHCLEDLAALAAGAEPERAALLFGASAAHRAALSTPAPPGEALAREDLLQAVRARLGDDRFAAAWAHGEALLPYQAVEAGLG